MPRAVIAVVPVVILCALYREAPRRVLTVGSGELRGGVLTSSASGRMAGMPPVTPELLRRLGDDGAGHDGRRAQFFCALLTPLRRGSVIPFSGQGDPPR